jgi:hypothetical protein
MADFAEPRDVGKLAVDWRKVELEVAGEKDDTVCCSYGHRTVLRD